MLSITMYTFTIQHFKRKVKVILATFVSPAKQKRDICTAFPASSLSSSSLSSSLSSASAA